MSKRLLILGANGMLGGSLFRYFESLGSYEVLGTVRSDASKGGLVNQGFSKNIVSGVDFLDLTRLKEIVADFKPDLLLNCIGVIKQVDDARLPIRLIELNSLLPHRLAELCSQNGCRLIHFSTDCVFAGDRGNYLEADAPDASDLYGRSKALGEVDYDNHLTLRTSLIGHELRAGVSLIDWFLKQKGVVKGYANAVFSGVPTVFLAEVLDRYILSSEIKGLFHLGVKPIDKYQLLELVKRNYNVDVVLEAYHDMKIDRSLNSKKFQELAGFSPPEWPVLISKMRNEYEQYFL